MNIAVKANPCFREVDRSQKRYIVMKGSVAVDGISLTVAGTSSSGFTVAVIPHTADVTTVRYMKNGDTVNLETDIVGKYVEKLILPEASGKSSGITMNSTLSEVLEDEKASLVFKPLVDAFITPFLGKSDGMSRMQVAMASDMPLRAAAVLTGAISLDEIREKLEELT